MFSVYQALMSERENDGKRLWILFGLMNVINGAFPAYVFTKELEPGISKALMALLGLIISVLWWRASRRLSAWIE